MAKLPLTITPCPLFEAVFEIRFESSFPGDAIFGIVFNEFKDEFKQVELLPILQLPAAIRNQDQNLKFSPHYKIQRDNYIIQIGPNVFSLTNINEYCGWQNFSKKIQDTYNKLSALHIFDKQYRTALRYINLVQDINIFSKSNLIIKFNKDVLGEDPINFTAEIKHKHGSSNLKLINYAELQLETKVIKGSIVDIDTNVNTEDFQSFEEAINYAHITEKTLFFSLLEKKYLASLTPVYEEK